MILTDSGIAEMIHLRDTLTVWLRAALGLPPIPQSPIQPLWNGRVNSHFSSDSVKGPFQTPMSFTSPEFATSSAPLTPDEQRARVIALRGMSQAREGVFSAAEETFAEAVKLDPSLDLRRLPSFWHSPRQVHEAAIGALLSAGRTRDASELIADLRTRYRPRLLPGHDED